MKKSKERIALFILSLFLISFFLAFEPELYIIVNNQFNFQIFLKVLFLISLGALLVAPYERRKKKEEKENE